MYPRSCVRFAKVPEVELPTPEIQFHARLEREIRRRDRHKAGLFRPRIVCGDHLLSPLRIPFHVHHLFIAVFMSDNRRFGKLLVAPCMVKMRMCIDYVLDRFTRDVANIMDEVTGEGRHTERIDHQHSAIADDETRIREAVNAGGRIRRSPVRSTPSLGLWPCKLSLDCQRRLGYNLGKSNSV